ncbi:MAG: protoporphyrinogen oxidase [Chloroflexi bacterium]|nr:MAG: protoporphyrinogen oxidase [Chloroflexota bacterium]
MNKVKIAVIGAGISGLSAAYWLDRAGHAVTVFEQSSQIGGSIVTEKASGFLADFGPNSVLETSETLRTLVSELGLDRQKVYANPAARERYVVKDGVLHPVPTTPLKFVKTKLFSAAAKLRLLQEPFIARTDGRDLSLADLVRYRLGQELLDYAVNPFVAGVYAGDPERLSAAAAFPKLYDLEQKYGSFIRGTIQGVRERKKRKEIAKDRARLFSFIDGMESLPRALAARLEGKILLRSGVQRLVRHNGGFVVEGGDRRGPHTMFDRVILTAPADALGRLLQPLAPEKAQRIAAVEYSPVAVVFMGFPAAAVARELNGFGFLVPAVERRQILGSIWSSALFPQRAPDGCVAFTTFVGGARQPELVALADESLVQIVHQELGELVGLCGSPTLVRVKRWAKAIPQYTLGYGAIQQLFGEIEREIPGLYIAGNLRRGISVGDSVLSAHETVQRIVTQG